MKRFQRLNAFILTLALFMSMIPAGILPVVALDAQDAQMENGANYLHASYSEETITVDGVMNLTEEPAYRRTITVGGNAVSAVWDDAGKLYLGASAAITDLKVNNVDVTADATEIQILTSSVGISDLGKMYPVSFKVGGVVWSGKLIFEANIYAKLPTHMQYSQGAANLDEDGWQVELDSYRDKGVEEESTNKQYDLYYPELLTDKTKLDLTVSYTAPTVIEMDLTVKTMPALTEVPKTYEKWDSRMALKGALNIVMRDSVAAAAGTNAGDALVTGLYRIGTDLYLMYPDNANQEVHSVKIGTYSEDYDTTEIYHLRMEYSYRLVGEVTVADVVYYVNGAKVAEQTDVYKNATTWGTGRKLIQFAAYAKNDINVDDRVEVIVENLSITHAQAGLEVYKLISAIQTPADPAAVAAAEAAYNALTDDAQIALVTNKAVLDAAKANLANSAYLHAA